ncbi:MAG: BREX-1 system adenine-specific DNA-methyltransferase PglX, partial [Actinomycetota bacterium]|nr:BREX-1 system adenine-specific DNA-methyltransferase PglX [Actinomycetota bacterium]
MTVLSSELRSALERAIVAARDAAEAASRVALDVLGVDVERVSDHLHEDERGLRVALRAEARQLGGFERLVEECAYEQWHRMMFARFLAENELLIHPEHGVAVSLADCEEIAHDRGLADLWVVASEFAAAMLPGIFRPDDPALRVRLAPEGQQALEEVLAGLPSDVFTSDDGLGWVYQYWQAKKKKEVNASERKIGGADIAPVTQLFTEHYMVAFLLENTLGAWWAARHPESSLVKDWKYLRFDDEGKPAAGSFAGWPESVAEVTVMDPCCGSGHFLVTAFEMLRQMRMEAEGVTPGQAGDAVLCDNLFGLELDARCTQIAAFALALQAWKTGGYRYLPLPNIACSGMPVKAPVEEWKAFAGGDPRLAEALEVLHVLFRDADTLGSLIDPRQTVENSAGQQTSFSNIAWDEISPLLMKALAGEQDDPVTAVLGTNAAGLARAAEFLAGRYTLVTTNVPYLKRANQTTLLRDYTASRYPESSQDLGVAFLDHILQGAAATAAFVTPTSWTTATSFSDFRRRMLTEETVNLLALLGARAFRAISGEVVNVALAIISDAKPTGDFAMLDASGCPDARSKETELLTGPVVRSGPDEQLAHPDHRSLISGRHSDTPLSGHARAYQGLATADYARFGRVFWEMPAIGQGWEPQQSTVSRSVPYGGREHVVHWEAGDGPLARSPAARVQGLEAWGSMGVAVSQMGMLQATLYTG